MKNKLRFYIRVNKQRLYQGKFFRRFLKAARLIDWSSNPKVYLKVAEAKKQLDNFGTVRTFYNDGDYFDKDSFWLALGAFCEDEYSWPPETVKVVDDIHQNAQANDLFMAKTNSKTSSTLP